MDLFSEVTGVSSGDVPRTIAPGVIWDEAAERRFVDAVKHMTTFGLMGKGYARAEAERSARWSVEAELHRHALHREMLAVSRCRDDGEKRALIARWREEYGQQRCNELIKRAANPDAKRVALEDWRPA